MASYSNICLSSGIGARMVLILIFLALVGIKNNQIKMSLSNVSLKEEKIAKLSLRDSVRTACDMEHETGCILPEPKWIKP